MSWVNEDGRHEGYLHLVLQDGWQTGTSSGRGPVVMVYDENGRYTGEEVQRSDDEIVAWQLRCDCSDPSGTGRGSTWDGPRWERVATLALEDIANGKIYAPLGEAMNAGERDDVEAVAREAWRTLHLAPLEALFAIATARRDVAEATQRLDQAVAIARAAGKTWREIGAAAGMSHQGAHDRWASTQEQVDAVRSPSDFVLGTHLDR